MPRAAKIAVSIPAETLKALERARARTGRSRSAAVTEAIEAWLRGTEEGELDRRYMAGYLHRPEATADIEATATAVTAAWEPWD